MATNENQASKILKRNIRMIPENIIEILLDNQKLITEEFDSINKSIIRIEDALKTASGIILQKLLSEANNKDVNKEFENKCLKQSQDLRTYANTLRQIETFSPLNDEERQIVEENFNSNIVENASNTQTVYVLANQICPICNRTLITKKISIIKKYHNHIANVRSNGFTCKRCNKDFILDSNKDNFDNSNIRLDTSYYNRLSTHEIIVLNSLKQCSSKDHKLEDVEAIIMTVLPNGLISPETINISYCRNCDQYIATILEYNELKGIPLCKVIDKTKEENQSNKHTTYDSSNYDKTGSKLTQYGYNVNVSDNLTKEQRQTILGVQIYNGMTKAEIICYIDSNIHNGELRKDSAKSWDNAISKWKEDKEFVQNFDNEKFIKKIDVDKIILKYTRHKNPK